MLNFTVGPVMENEIVRAIGSEQIPYFRTTEFSDIMFENEKLMKKFAKAEKDSRVVFITGSGTASMEASIINCFSLTDKVLIVNGGSFGQRFVDICSIYNVPFEEIKLEVGEALTEECLDKYSGKGFTGLLINVHETSTGVHYDIDMVSKFCKKNHLFFVVDAVSSFLADKFNMEDLGVDIMITGSQKALACPPGISIMVLSPKAIERVVSTDSKCFYLNIKNALKDGERGQTPFTPAVGTLLQINARLKEIENNGGVDKEVERIAELANDFRSKIVDLPFEFISDSMSNAVTALHPTTNSAHEIFLKLKDEYNIWVCPNGGKLKDNVFRVGHIGDLSITDNDILISAFNDLQSKGFL